MKSTSLITRIVAAGCCLSAMFFSADAQTIWTGGAGSDTNWSNGNNWSTLAAPGPGTAVLFTNAAVVASTNTPNNAVDTSVSIGSLQFTNFAPSATPNYHVTLISPGQTLTITGGLIVGPGASAGDSQVVNAVIRGAGATLNVSGGNFAVGQSSANDGTKLATLDLSGLDVFTATVNRFMVAVQQNPAGLGSNNKSRGLVYLARTNVITVSSTGTTNSFLIGWNNGSGTPNAAVVYLGQTNAIFADSVTVGTVKQNGCLFAFNPTGLSSPSAYFRNTTGANSRVSNWAIGDESLLGASNQNVSGTNDFSGGTVDALVDAMRLGGSNNGNNTGSGNGTLTFNAGLIDVNTLQAGYQTFNANTASGNGTVNVNGTATLRVNSTLELAHLASAAGSASGTLNVNGGSAFVNSAVNGGGVVRVSVNGGALVISNNAFGSATAALAAFNATNSSLTLPAILSANSVTTTNLATGGTTNVLNIGSIPLISGYPVTFHMIKYATLSGGFNIGLGTLPASSPSFKGFLTNDPVSLSVDLVLTNGPALVRSLAWRGQLANTDWDADFTPNWTTGVGTTTYHDLDFVRFDDTAVTNYVNVAGIGLTPSAMVVSNETRAYTFAGFGSVAGATALTKQGAAALTIDTSFNTFTGGLNILGGTVQVGAGDTQGDFGPGGVLDNGVLAFDRVDNITITNVISGSGAVTLLTNGMVTLGGGNSFGGAVNVTRGTLRVDNNSALGATNGGTIVSSGATLDVGSPSIAANTLNLGPEPITASGAGTDGNGAIVNSSSKSQQNALRLLTLAGNTTVGGAGLWSPSTANTAGRWDIRGTGAALLTGNQPYSLIKTGANEVVLVGVSVDPALGDVDVQQGLLQLEGATTSLGNPAANLFVRSGGTIGFNSTTNLWNKIIDVTGNGIDLSVFNSGGSSTVVGPMTINGPCLFSIGGTSLTLSNTVTGGGGITTVTPGTATLVLSGPTKTYSGGTTVGSGKLVLNTVIAGSGLTNNNATTVAGNGTNNGPVEINGTIQPGDVNVAGTFGAGGFTLNGNIVFDLNHATTPGGGVNDLVNVSGDLTFNGGLLTINPIGLLQTGPYRLFNYSGSRTGTPGDPAPVGRYTFTLSFDDLNKHVDVGVAGGPTSLRWVSLVDGTWDTQNAVNWTTNASGTTATDQFFAQDSVLFDDTAGVGTNITVSGTVSPTFLTNNSSANFFTFAGAGHISGQAGIVKQGTSLMTLSTSNDFTGPIIIAGGTLKINSTSALGLTNGVTVISNNAALDLGGPSFGGNALNSQETIYVSGAGPDGNGAIINSHTNAQDNALHFVVLTGDTTFGGPGDASGGGNSPGRWDIRDTGADASLSTGGQPYNLTKAGSNQVTLVNVDVDTNLANIEVRGGTFGLQGSTTLGNPTNTLTVFSNALLHLTSFTVTPVKSLVVRDGGIVDSTSGSNTLGGPVTLQGSNTFNITSTVLLLSNSVSGAGILNKMGGSQLQLGANSPYTGRTLINGGRLSLIGAGAIGASSNLVLNTSGATLDAIGRADQTLTLGSGQTLSGIGTVAGNLTAAAGSTISPGTNSIGRLNTSSNVTLLGTVVMEINKATTNDQLFATGTIAYGGTLAISNLGAAFVAGDSFKLFNGSGYSGAFTLQPATPGSGLAWNTGNLAVDGTLSVVSAVVPQPQITTVTASGTNLVIAGTNGLPSGTYHVLTSSNVATPLSNWTAFATNSFDVNGAFNFTNGIDRTTPRKFYIIAVPVP